MSVAPIARAETAGRPAACRRERRQALAHAFALTTLAVAQPLFDLLGRFPAFLVARGLSAPQVVLLALILAWGPILLVASIAELVGLAGGPRVRRQVYGATMAGSVAILTLLALRRVPVESAAVASTIAVVVAFALAVAYRSFVVLRKMVSVLAWLAIVPLLAFLLSTPIRRLWLPSIAAKDQRPAAIAGSGPATRPIPVALVVLDELPASSLTDADGVIDRSLFPSLAALAATATWFPDSAAAAVETDVSVPAILTGLHPRPGRLATTKDQPWSLFTLLAASHQLQVSEPKTKVCPAQLCRRPAADLAAVAADLGIVYLHLVLPRPLAARLPSVTTTWDQFSGLVDRDAAIWRFLDGLAFDSQRPPFVFLHAELPHQPWIYLPNGRSYHPGSEAFLDGLVPGTAPWGRWIDDPWVVRQGLQRHLLQAAYTDRLIGRLLDRLKQAGLYDSALIVVTADHGISFRAGGLVRSLDEHNVRDVAGVPLLVKLPFQHQGKIDTSPASGVDVAPTIADVLGAELPWRSDGESLLSRDPRSDRVRFVFSQTGERHQLGRLAPPVGPGPSANRLFRWVPDAPAGLASLLGGEVSRLEAEAADRRAELDGAARYLALDPAADPLPCRVTGRLSDQGDGAASRAPVLALAVDGVVWAVSRARSDPGREGEFSFMIDSAAWRSGSHVLGLYEARDGAGGLALHRVALPNAGAYALTTGPDGAVLAIEGPHGRRHVVEPALHAGRAFDGVRRSRGASVAFGGTAEAGSGARLETVVLFVGGRFVHAAPMRPAGALGFGFRFDVPRSEVEGGSLRFFVLDSEGRASPLPYAKANAEKANGTDWRG